MSLIDGFLDQCSSNPTQCALIQDGLRLTYSELDTRASRIASALKNRGVGPGDRLACALDRGIDATTVIYGALYLGACYVPLDLANPAARLRTIIDDAQVKVVVGDTDAPPWLDDASQWLNLKGSPTEDGIRPVEIDDADLAAILYTSGSSGRPKGVALSHRAMATFAHWAGETFDITENDRIASLSPFHFDLSVFDLFTSLASGATLDFVPSKLTMMPAKLVRWLSEHKISSWYTIPSLLGFLSLKGNLSSALLPELRQILFAGEVFPTPRLIGLLERLPQTRFYNLFGPTETNVCCYWPVDRKRLDEEQPIPIGVPACDAQLRLDEDNGELQIKGPALLSGYWCDGQLHDATDQDGWYPSGDRASLNDLGEYLYHGRLDRMIKCSGYRVEPGEIEAVIRTVPGVLQCAVVGLDDPTSGQRAAAVVVLEPSLDAAELNRSVQQRLPAYMQPTRYLQLEQMPVLSNGKLDYQTIEQHVHLNAATFR